MHPEPIHERPAAPSPRTLAELEAAGYRPRAVKREMRENLARRLRERQPLFPGIVGFERTVVPSIQNAILSGHDFILLGLRGQAKTRLLRALPALLDEWIPAVEGCEIRDDPLLHRDEFHLVSLPSQRPLKLDLSA